MFVASLHDIEYLYRERNKNKVSFYLSLSLHLRLITRVFISRAFILKRFKISKLSVAFSSKRNECEFYNPENYPPTITQTYFIRVIGQFEQAIFGWSRSDDGRHRLFGSTLVKINDWSTNSPWKTRENRRERRSLLEGARTSFDTRKFFTTTRRNRFANSRKK